MFSPCDLGHHSHLEQLSPRSYMAVPFSPCKSQLQVISCGSPLGLPVPRHFLYQTQSCAWNCRFTAIAPALTAAWRVDLASPYQMICCSCYIPRDSQVLPELRRNVGELSMRLLWEAPGVCSLSWSPCVQLGHHPTLSAWGQVLGAEASCTQVQGRWAKPGAVALRSCFSQG